ncbi:hypothetical protein F511_23400 [Dorcoceras hygrometricum]|uniref:Uncharacterized protein n=1 Tax=Dorcoceras hygrometricum TaxID=472368 RepID=A0A2Z7C3R1_9LAMI|nr:hypothetical protein F511_23400 [Dorcoceras hygrometricum]
MIEKPPRSGRAARNRVNESRADFSVEDEAVAQPSVPLHHRERQSEAKVEHLTRQTVIFLLLYVPHVANQERTKQKKSLRVLRADLFQLVLAGSPSTFAEAVDRVVDIVESLLDAQTRVKPIDRRGFHPVPEGMYSFQLPQTSQQ